MKRLFFTTLFLSAATLLYVSCRKDKISPTESVGFARNQDSVDECKVFVRGSGGTQIQNRNVEGDEPKKMILGDVKPNPFARSVMTQAYNNIYEPNVAQVPFTHLYVRFLPNNAEQYSLLGDIEGLDLFDFPLDREIIEQGDYYHDPMIPEGQFTWQYAVVKPDFVFPAGIQHEILEQIVNAPFKSKLTREAFRIAYNSVGSGMGNRPVVSNRDYEECAFDCNYYPECIELPEYGCGGDVGGTGTGGGGQTNFPGDEIPCEITDPNWPNCEELPVVTTITNGCGCPVSTNSRFPGGCVRVVDTQLPANGFLPNGTPVHLDGVKQARILWWNGWFGIWTTYTDDNGCWQIREEDHGVGHLWVTFKNDRAKIRGIRDEKIWEYSVAVKDYLGKMSGPAFNNISVIYNTGGSSGSAALLFWYAATANNALWDYYNFAAADGIALPPSDLKVLLTNYSGDAAAPLLEKTGFNWLAAGGIVALTGFLFPLQILFVPIAVLSTYFAAFAPDVVYNYSGSIAPSDRVKETFYHEFAHTSHYMGLPKSARNAYWGSNIGYVLNNVITSQNPPYGTRGLPGHERCAIIEMWGYHLGPQYADRKYGLLHSRGNFNPVITENRRWRYVNEPFIPDVLGNSSLDAFMPKGLFHDLIDNNALNPTGVVEGIPSDPVSGFTHGNCFNAVTLGVPQVMTNVEANINTALPPGVNPVMTRLIFGAYGY